MAWCLCVTHPAGEHTTQNINQIWTLERGPFYVQGCKVCRANHRLIPIATESELWGCASGLHSWMFVMACGTLEEYMCLMNHYLQAV
jgi:hypothetical protein